MRYSFRIVDIQNGDKIFLLKTYIDTDATLNRILKALQYCVFDYYDECENDCDLWITVRKYDGKDIGTTIFDEPLTSVNATIDKIFGLIQF